MDLWPERFYVYLGSRRTPHNDVEVWVKRNAPPICVLMADDDIKAWVERYAPPISVLMADKLPDPTANALNQAAFDNLSRMLLDSRIVRPSILSGHLRN
jgi:hypothetical protein